MAKNKKRGHSIISRLDDEKRRTVNYMIDNGYMYDDIVAYIKSIGVSISKSSVHRYKERYEETVKELRFIHTNASAIAEETQKYPNLDFTEASIRMVGYKLMEFMQDLDAGKFNEQDPLKVINTFNNLVKSIAIKTTADAKSKEARELAYEQFKEELFVNLRKERPDLYDQLVAWLNEKKESDWE